MQTSDFGDERLDDRFQVLVDRFSQKPSLSIPAACHRWSETIAAYRIFDNDRVDEAKVLQPHQDATLQRIQEHDVVLLIQDATEIEVTRPEEQVEGAGPLNDESRLGFFDHAMLAVTPGRIPLGVVDADIGARDFEEFRENQQDKQSPEKKRKQKPIEEQQSLRWLEGYRRGCEVAEQAPPSTIVVISDSEGDIFECFAEADKDEGAKRANWIVRACQDRSLAGQEHDGGWAKLWAEVGSSEVLGTMEVEVSQHKPKSQDDRKRKQPRTARTAKMTIASGASASQRASSARRQTSRRGSQRGVGSRERPPERRGAG